MGGASTTADGKSSEIVGAVLRTRVDVKPVFVSVGHRISLPEALRMVMACVTRFRLPETTRWADGLASKRRGKWLEEGVSELQRRSKLSSS